jgi:hypothetical protein
MDMAWSRWLLVVWAFATAFWLATATLMLVHTWPEPVGIDREALFGNAGDEGIAGRAVRAEARVQASPAVKTHLRNFLLFAVLPPLFLLALVGAALWILGLPFPSIRRGGRNKLSSPG